MIRKLLSVAIVAGCSAIAVTSRAENIPPKDCATEKYHGRHEACLIGSTMQYPAEVRHVFEEARRTAAQLDEVNRLEDQHAENLRSFRLLLSTIANGSPATPEGLEAVVEYLRDTGSSAADAKESVEMLIRLKPRGLNVSDANVKALTTLGRNIAAATGRSNEVWETEALGWAVTEGNGDALIKYAGDLGALTGAQGGAAALDSVLKLQRKGERDKAVTVILNDLVRLYDGKFTQSQAAK